LMEASMGLYIRSALQKSASSDSVGLSEETIRRCRAVAFANLRWLTHS
jgi:hypothetical protein